MTGAVDGVTHGLPTYPWESAPLGLATAEQLQERRLRPGGKPVAVRVRWRGNRIDEEAYLYDVATARRRHRRTAA
jgi:hypothetical protein